MVGENNKVVIVTERSWAVVYVAGAQYKFLSLLPAVPARRPARGKIVGKI